MSYSAEALLRAVRRAVAKTGVPVNTDATIDRLRLEAALDDETREMRCQCDDFAWDED